MRLTIGGMSLSPWIWSSQANPEANREKSNIGWDCFIEQRRREMFVYASIGVRESKALLVPIG
jgi:hypothetical protein